jgi:nitrate reductase delta subunit
MMRTLKVLSALLVYPTGDLQRAAPELVDVIDRERLLPTARRDALAGLIADIARGDLFDIQERYVFLFDRTRSLSLHLFEHVHGESRDRGQAMVDLIRVYEEGGWRPSAKELPDYLPLFLEYAATRPAKQALDLLAQTAHVLQALAERLRRRNSPYTAVFDALVTLSKAKPDGAMLERLMAEPDPEPDDLEALDAAWAEEEVLFGPGAAAQDCGKEELAARLRQARRPAPGAETVPPAGPRTVITHAGAPAHPASARPAS